MSPYRSLTNHAESWLSGANQSTHPYSSLSIRAYHEDIEYIWLWWFWLRWLRTRFSQHTCLALEGIYRRAQRACGQMLLQSGSRTADVHLPSLTLMSCTVTSSQMPPCQLCPEHQPIAERKLPMDSKIRTHIDQFSTYNIVYSYLDIHIHSLNTHEKNSLV